MSVFCKTDCLLGRHLALTVGHIQRTRFCNKSPGIVDPDLLTSTIYMRNLEQQLGNEEGSGSPLPEDGVYLGSRDEG